MNRIVFSDGTVFTCPEQAEPSVDRIVDYSEREWRKITVSGELADVIDKFIDGAVYRYEWDSEYMNPDESITIESHSEDLSGYSIRGDIIVHQSGNITVYMGKPTEVEMYKRKLAELGITL